MPIWLRRFTFEKIKEFYEKEQEQQEKQTQLVNNKKTVSRPNIAPKPTYTVKAPKK
jgi:hypothetical protein